MKSNARSVTRALLGWALTASLALAVAGSRDRRGLRHRLDGRLRVRGAISRCDGKSGADGCLPARCGQLEGRVVAARPLLVLSGEKAGGTFLIDQAKLVATDVRGTIIMGSGHWLIDEARQQVIPALVEFIN